MYEGYSKQSVPERKYRELLGTAICVFNSNNNFIIENILYNSDQHNWYELIDQESGKLKRIVKENIRDAEIVDLFSELVEMRNRIIHSYQITDTDKKQKLATKTKQKDGNIQFVIKESYLLDFIKKNERLCLLLHNYRNNHK